MRIKSGKLWREKRGYEAEPFALQQYKFHVSMIKNIQIIRSSNREKKKVQLNMHKE